MTERDIDCMLRLPDGRQFGWASYEDPAGAPVIALHGSPDSRIIWGLFDEAATKHRLRLLAPDRAGFGLSDPHPGASVVERCDDVAHLAEHLGIDQFMLLAISGGAVFAATCAWRLAPRVNGLGLLGVIGPVGRPGAKREMNLLVRLTYALATRAPWALRPLVRALARSASEAPKKAAARVERTGPPEDIEIIRRPEVRTTLLENIPNQFRDPETIMEEFRIATRPWPVPLDEIDVPTHIWQGGVDTVHTPSMAHYLATRIPGAKLTLEPDFATFTFLDHLDPIMETLRSWTAA